MLSESMRKFEIASPASASPFDGEAKRAANNPLETPDKTHEVGLRGEISSVAGGSA